MGKAEEELSLSAAAAQEEEGRGSPGGNAGARCRHCLWIRRVVRPRCVAALVLGVAVLLSALFWLPPFLRDGADPDGLDSQAGSNIIASFQLRKPLSQLKAYIPELQYDVSAEIGVANSSVIIISLERLPASNWTNVVFGIWPYPKDSNISSAGLSILRSNFVMLVTQQSTLRLTASLFGNPSFFQVLQFPGGITIIPPQSGFLLQKQLMFNFTLNFSINQVYNKINELKDQMKSGLHLNYFENLYVSLTNLRGSTVTPPTIIQTSILLSVGNRPPSQLRLKELAQAITPARNLGLNNTVFGIVKQIRLSSFLNHSINGAGAPSSAPEPHPSHPSHHHHHHHHHHHNHHHHHHHHHQYHHRQHHHHQHHNPYIDLAPAPAPQYNDVIPPPGGQTGCPPKSNSRSYFDPIAPSVTSHHYSAPHLQGKSPAPISVTPPESSHIPNVLFTQVEPPSKSTHPAKLHDKVPSSCTTAILHYIHWSFALPFYLLACL